METTIGFIQKTGLESIGTVAGLWILPGTELYGYAKKIGLIDDDFWLGNEPYMVYTHEHSPRKLRFYSHALKKQKKLSEMSLRYKLRFFLHTYCEDSEKIIMSFLNKHPRLKSLIKSCYQAVKSSFHHIVRSDKESR